MVTSRHLLCLLGAVCALVGQGHAQTLRITEVMSSAADTSYDWFEVTNYGTSAVTLGTNWKMDDGSNALGSSTLLNGITTIGAGESVIFVEGTSATAGGFISLWNLTGVQVGYYSGSGLSLSSGGDGVNLFYQNSATTYTGVSFGANSGGYSFYWTYDVSGAISGGPSQSIAGQNGAFLRSSGTDIASPGVAQALTSPTTLNWIGGSGIWTASGGSNWQGGAWNSSKTAVFATTGGTVNVAENVTALGLDFRTGDYVVSGAGQIETSSVTIGDAGDHATINAVITGTGGLNKFGAGTLELGAENTYTGLTSVSQGTIKLAIDNAIADASAVSIALGAKFDMNGHSDTVAGLTGLGTVEMGSGNLTVSASGSANQEFNGGLHGLGDFIVDSTGSGDQIFDTRASTASEVKDYTGRTIIRNGTLRVSESGMPGATSEVLIEGGKLRLSTELAEYTFGGNTNVSVTLAGGAIRQDDGESVTLKNNIDVTADSAIESRVDSGDPFSAPVVTFSGAISGTGGLEIKGGGRVDITSAGSYSGTVSVTASHLRVNGSLSAGTVLLGADSTLSGSGRVASIGGEGKVNPGNSPGILTASSIDPSAGLDFAFEFTGSGPNYSDAFASGNDVLRLTGLNPLQAGLASGNTMEIFLSVSSLSEGDFFRGGFYLDQQTNFDSLVAGANLVVYVLGDGNGTDATLDGFGYYSLANFDGSLAFTVSTITESADFGSGTINGSVLQLTAVPEPRTWLLIVATLGAFIAMRRSRKTSQA